MEWNSLSRNLSFTKPCHFLDVVIQGIHSLQSHYGAWVPGAFVEVFKLSAYAHGMGSIFRWKQTATAVCFPVVQCSPARLTFFEMESVWATLSFPEDGHLPLLRHLLYSRQQPTTFTLA